MSRGRRSTRMFLSIDESLLTEETKRWFLSSDQCCWTEDVTLSLKRSMSDMLLFCEIDCCQETFDSLSESLSLSPAELIWACRSDGPIEEGWTSTLDVDAGDPPRESTKPLWKPAILESSMLKLIAAKPILFIHLAISSRVAQEKYSRFVWISSTIRKALVLKVITCRIYAQNTILTISFFLVPVRYFFLPTWFQFLDFYPKEHASSSIIKSLHQSNWPLSIWI